MANNYQKNILLCICFLIAWLLSGCGENIQSCVELPADTQKETINYVRLEEDLFNSRNVEDTRKILFENPLFAKYFLDGNEYPSMDIIANKLLGIANNPSIDTVYQETIEAFGNLEGLTDELSTAYAWLKYYYPKSKTPLVKTTITGLYNDLYVSDSLLIIGLDYFIGEGATFRPINTPQYILKRYEKESIIPLIFSFVSENYADYDRKDNTLIADMINYGKSYYFTKKMMPCKNDGWIVGYSEEELLKIGENEDIIWAHFIDRQLLFETDHFKKNKYISERPNVYEIGDQCPGRIGRWLGWQIVNAYMKRNPDVSLQQLMKETNVQKILNDSKYKPQGK